MTRFNSISITVFIQDFYLIVNDEHRLINKYHIKAIFQ